MIIRAVRPSEYEIAGELTVEAYRTIDAGDAVYEREPEAFAQYLHEVRDIAGRRGSSEILVRRSTAESSAA